MSGSGVPLDTEAMGAALRRRVTSCAGIPVGAGQLADSFRVTLTYDGPPGPASIFLKLPSSDPDSAATASRIGAYHREARFYRDLLPRLEVRTPQLLGVLQGGGSGPGLLLEDLSDRARPLDQLRDGTIDQVTSTLDQLPGLQAPLWDDAEIGDRPWFYNRLTDHIEGLVERYGISWDRYGNQIARGLTAEQVEMVELFGPRLRTWAAGVGGPRTLVHQDLRLDNILWGDDGAWLVDWQTLSWGPPAWDLAFLLGSALEPSDRRSVERDAVARHVERLAERGVDWPWDQAWESYRHLAGAVLLGMVPAMAYVEPTDRGFDMFRSLIARGAQAAIDLDLPALLENTP